MKKKKLKILVLQCFDFPNGQSNRSYLFADKLQKLGHEITYLTNQYNHLDVNIKDKFTAKINRNIKHIFINNKKVRKNKLLSILMNAISVLKLKKKFDIIIGPSVPLVNSLTGLALAKLTRAKFFFEIRDVWPDALVYNEIISKFNPIYLILKFLELIIYKFCDGVISALPNTKHYVKFYNNKLPHLYLPNSYKPYPKYKKKFNNKLTRAVYIGRFNSDHDIEIILKAAEYLLKKKKYNILFDLFGYGNKLELIKKTINEKKLSNIKLRGTLNKSYVFSTLQKYDLALCTITNSKAFQWGTNLNKICEYFNSSMPVIFAGNVPQNPVQKAKCGYQCKTYNYKMLAEQILKFSKLKINEKRKLSNNAKDFFDIEYNLDKQAKVLENFLNSNSYP